MRPDVVKTFDIQFSFKPLRLSIRRGEFTNQKDPTVRDLQQRQHSFRRDRPLFDTKDTGSHLVDRLVEEAEEMRRELPADHKQPTAAERDKIAGELSDVLSFIFNIANHYGIDAALAFYSKMDEVEQRYPPHLFQIQDGRTFDQAYQEARALTGHN